MPSIKFLSRTSEPQPDSPRVDPRPRVHWVQLGGLCWPLNPNEGFISFLPGGKARPGRWYRFHHPKRPDSILAHQARENIPSSVNRVGPVILRRFWRSLYPPALSSPIQELYRTLPPSLRFHARLWMARQGLRTRLPIPELQTHKRVGKLP